MPIARQLLVACAALVLGSWWTTALAADAITIGVITSRSGAASAAGASQALAAGAWQAELRSRGGVFGVSVGVELADDASSAAQAVAQARDLIAAGVHALVCCTTTAAARAVAPVADAAGILLLSPAQLDSFGLAAVPDDQTAWTRWAFSLSPSDTDALAAVVADALGDGKGTLALMTLDNEFGDRAEEALSALVGYAGMRLVSTVRYSPNASELRPEALLLASHQPGGVVVWGLRDDLGVAVGALRRRGFEGAVYGRSALLAPEAQPPSWGTLAGVRFAVSPAYVAGTLPPQHACADVVAARATALASVYEGVADLRHAAPVGDALELLAEGLEQVVALQIPLDRPEVVRQALRDAVVGLPERCGAGGIIDVLDDRESAIAPRGLLAAEVTAAGLTAVP